MTSDAMALTKARSMLLILVASCNQTLLALDAVGNVLDGDMIEDLRRMIGQSEHELEALTGKIDGLRSD